MASSWRIPSKLFTCGICSEPCDEDSHEAKLLDCHHTFCSHCLTQWHRKKGLSSAGIIQCPSCNQLTFAPDNFYIECMKTDSVRPENPKPARYIERCHKHDGQMLSFFCETCDQTTSLDHDAVVSDHKETAGHTVVNIGDAGPSHGHSFECQLQTSNTPWTQIHRDIQCIESKMKEIQSHKDSALKDLDSYNVTKKPRMPFYSITPVNMISCWVNIDNSNELHNC